MARVALPGTGLAPPHAPPRLTPGVSAGPLKAPAEIRRLYGHAGRFREGVAVSREEVMP